MLYVSLKKKNRLSDLNSKWWIPGTLLEGSKISLEFYSYVYMDPIQKIQAVELYLYSRIGL